MILSSETGCQEDTCAWREDIRNPLSLQDGSLTPELRNLEGVGVEDELVESVTAVDSTSGQLMQLVVDHTTGEVSRCYLIADHCALSQTLEGKRMHMKRAAINPCAFANLLVLAGTSPS